MTCRRRADNHRITTLLAQECARLLAEEGIQDFRTAKRKAALRFRISDKAILPDNAEIEQALLDYQRLFYADHQALRLHNLRKIALEAMHFFTHFRPRLVGPTLSGAVGLHLKVHLHLFTDPPENVPLFLIEHHIPFETSEHRFTMANGDPLCQPTFSFTASDTPIELTVFALMDEREAPRSPVNGRPMRRAGLAEVQALLVMDRS